MDTSFSGMHWVGDLGLEAWVDIKSNTGNLLLETTEGGSHFRCQIDIATGKVSLSCTSSDVQFVDASGQLIESPEGECSIRGSGSHRILLMNADDRLFVWVDDRVVSFGGANYQDYRRSGDVLPQYSPEDPGDALPLGIGCQNASVEVSRMAVWRDTYYTSVTPQSRDSDYRIHFDGMGLNDLLDDPRNWSSSSAQNIFKSQRRTARDVRPLSENQYFPMGDNSPASQDARLWGEPPYVTGDLLLGRGLFLYWPHSWNKPFFGFPDFTRMKFIR
jgi:signal peptidase I